MIIHFNIKRNKKYIKFNLIIDGYVIHIKSMKKCLNILLFVQESNVSCHKRTIISESESYVHAF